MNVPVRVQDLGAVVAGYAGAGFVPNSFPERERRHGRFGLGRWRFDNIGRPWKVVSEHEILPDQPQWLPECIARLVPNAAPRLQVAEAGIIAHSPEAAWRRCGTSMAHGGAKATQMRMCILQRHELGIETRHNGSASSDARRRRDAWLA